MRQTSSPFGAPCFFGDWQIILPLGTTVKGAFWVNPGRQAFGVNSGNLVAVRPMITFLFWKHSETAVLGQFLVGVLGQFLVGSFFGSNFAENRILQSSSRAGTLEP